MMNHTRLRPALTLFTAALLPVCAAPTVFAAHGDVWMSTDTVNNKVDIGVVNEAGTEYTPGENTFEVILTADTLPFSPYDYPADDPGFRAAAGELPVSQAVDILLHSLTVWNGSGLDPTPGVAFSFDLSGGFSTETDGSMHEHPLYGLTDLTADALPIPDGVYVAAFRMSTAGLGDSNLARFVMLKDELIANETDAEALEGLLEDYEEGGPAPVYGGKDFSFFEEAVEYVETVPEPSGIVLAGCVALALAVRGRRR